MRARDSVASFTLQSADPVRPAGRSDGGTAYTFWSKHPQPAPMSPSPPPPTEPEPLGRFGLTRRERWSAIAAAAAAIALFVLLVVLFWKPGPPSTVVMSTGLEDGAYHAFGKRYQQILARSGVHLVLKPSAGALENLERLRGHKDGVTVALVQGGLAQPGDETKLVTLGAVAYEPVWMFHRATLPIQRFGDIAGLKVAGGVVGGGTRKVVETMMERNGIAGMQPPIVPLGGGAAADALERGEVDVAIFVSSAESPVIQRLLRANNVALWSTPRADAYVRQMPFLTRIEIPEGAADLARNLPPRPTTMVSLKADLVAVEDIHPVVVELLLDAAREIHGGGGLLRHPGEFPSEDTAEFPMSADAERFYRGGSSVLRRYLPYWAAVWIQRLLFFGLPLLAVGIPLFRTVPGLLRWSIRRRIYRWYGELSFLEQAVRRGQGDRATQIKRLEEIESRINRLRIPLSFAGEAYTLRSHVEMVRAQLVR